jgi:lipoprotein-releasing system ATP-binding protein
MSEESSMPLREAATPVLRTRGLKRSFTQGDVTIDVLRGVDLEVRPGEIVALLGPSGSGKSTLLQAVGLLEGGFEGSIQLVGREASELDNDARTELRREALGFVYQFHHLLPEFSAVENIMLPQMIRGLGRKEANRRALELLAYLGLRNRATHRPSELSGGEQQRVALARALANDPPIVLADEPTGNLDTRNGRHIMDLLRKIHTQRGTTIVLVTHDAELASTAEARLVLRDGRVVESVEQTPVLR